jgi:HEAT repeat protein
VSVTERLGQSKSPLTVDELLEALEDPRFYVRFEAIVSIARGSSDPRLTEALVEILQSKEPALSVIAAWALGRMGDPAALPALREGINAEYRSIRAHSARSLGSMGDRAAIPDLLERLRSEQNEDLRVAFGSALGALEAQQATADLLDLLYTNQDEDARLELALALARLVGNEHHFIHLWRAMRTEPGTAASQAMTSARKSIEHIVEDPALGRAIEDCAEVLARQELEEGTACISRLIPQLPLRDAGDTVALILNECALRLEEFGVQRREYLQLALHAMNEGWRK